jgi:hypothetical protein
MSSIDIVYQPYGNLGLLRDLCALIDRLIHVIEHLSTSLRCLGLIRQPKYSHLKELHKAIKQCEHALVSSDPTVTSLGTLQQVNCH